MLQYATEQLRELRAAEKAADEAIGSDAESSSLWSHTGSSYCRSCGVRLVCLFACLFVVCMHAGVYSRRQYDICVESLDVVKQRIAENKVEDKRASIIRCMQESAT